MPIEMKTLMEPFFETAAGTPLKIAPERGAELVEEIFKHSQWQLLPSELGTTFSAVPGERTVYMSYAGLAGLWCVAYSVFHIMEIASHHREELGKNFDISHDYNDRKINQHIALARRLIKKVEPWPEGVVVPNAAADTASIEGRINNLFFGALSWILLHEIGHVHRNHLKEIPREGRLKQEYQADAFATSWILDSARGDEREFRVLAICVALIWLFLSQESPRGDTVHPQPYLRFREAAAEFQLKDDSGALLGAIYAFKAILDPATPMPSFEEANAAFDWLAQRLENLFRN
jgi:Peptidase U49